jgi:3-isopropylmalate/(R)-2-methylmalate dehydratase small subunit
MSFTPFQSVRGPAPALLQPNIDTDIIIRVDHLTKSRDEVAAFAFDAIRLLPDGSEDPGFPLHQPMFRGAPILITGPNFGCGSSREPAVWALSGLGIRCIIGSTFGDIFVANCAQNGVLVVALAIADVERLASLCASGEPITVDLPAQTVTASDSSVWAFAVPAVTKQSLVSGLDDLELALRSHDAIARWQELDRVRRPWAWPTGTP